MCGLLKLRYLDFYQGPMTVYLHLYSTNFVSQFLLWSSIRTCLQSSHYEDNHYIFLCCKCQSLSMPNKACPKVQSFLVFGLFFYWFLNYTRGRAFRREISNIHTVRPRNIEITFPFGLPRALARVHEVRELALWLEFMRLEMRPAFRHQGPQPDLGFFGPIERKRSLGLKEPVGELRCSRLWHMYII